MSSEEDFASEDGIGSSTFAETGDALSVVFNKDIRPLIDLIDKLRRYGIQQDIQLPNVVVVGDQSSGKSSIIEALSGVQLPRGKGIVTRCPLELQLKRVYEKAWKAKITYRNKNGLEEEYTIDRPSEVEYNVHKAQEAICGIGKGVSSELITLRIESPEETAPDLTLIDLPGIARIALEGQPHDICDTIKSIIMKYVRPERSVILCVISANLDVAVNESVCIARTVDPQGERTIGVLTKPDAAEESNKEDILCLLNNEKIKLQKGFSMVKCRSQPELEMGVSLKQSMINEKEFFENDRVFRQANSCQLGIMNLAKKITSELVTVIKKSIPELKEQIENALQEAHRAMDLLAEAVPTDPIERKSYLTRTIWNVIPSLRDCLIEGRNARKDENYYYGWRQNFTEFLKQMENKTINALKKNFSQSNLKALIERNRGRELSGFHDFEIFKTLIPKHVALYNEDAVTLLMAMKRNIEICLSKVVTDKCYHLPEILMDMKEIISDETKKSQKEAEDKIKFIFKQESIIFTMDAIFNKDMSEYKQKKAEALIAAEKRNRNSQLNEVYFEEDSDTNPAEIHDMLKVYLNIVNHRLSDTIPLTIMQCLLMELFGHLEHRLIEMCTSEEAFDKVKENSTLTNKRQVTKDKINRLLKANREISRF